MASFLDSCASRLQGFTTMTGNLCKWLSLLMVIIACAIVALRSLFDYSSIAMQETVMYLHSALFMFGAAYTWQKGEHVRVDVLYQRWPEHIRNRIDLGGTLLLLMPTCLFLLYISWDYVAIAWSIREQSQEAGGLPFVYVLKSLIIVMPVLMLIQALAILPALIRGVKQKEQQHG